MSEDITNTIQELIKGRENEYLEFKRTFNKDDVGERISAIANAVSILGRDFGYIIIGVDDKTKDLVGTEFDFDTEKVGNMPIENWLLQHLDPKPDLVFCKCFIQNKKIILIKIPGSTNRPISFNGIEYIRIGEVTRRLKDFPDKEKVIWNNQKNRDFEKSIAIEYQSESEVLQLLDYDKYFQLTKQQLPSETKQFIDKMSQDGLIYRQDGNRYKITVTGAILFARNINNFPIISRKTVRVIKYEGNTRVKRKSEREGERGYASGFESLIDYINTQVPTNEEIQKALRVEEKTYPEVAIREIIANALIHQDFSIKGTGPLIEIFDNRIEITNPGAPLIDVNRFIDHPPRSRNETIASLMRRFGFCEESGSGIDRALINIELFQLPAPKFETLDQFTRVTLLAPLKLKDMTEEDKIRACFQHCVLKYLSKTGRMTNASLRERLGINENNYPSASRIIKASIDKGFIKESDKLKEYVPWWA